MSDPLDTPPVDHGSDRYDYVEVNAPGLLTPSGAWWNAVLAQPCPDCRANVFIYWTGLGLKSQHDPQSWRITIAHDETCPTEHLPSPA